MASSSAQVEMGNGGGSGEPPTTTHAHAQAPPPYAHARAYRYGLVYAHVRAFVSLAVKGSGFLALLLSTVVLLGGFVSSLEKADFFCITVITVIQAAGIFKDWEKSLRYALSFLRTFIPLMDENDFLIWNFVMKLHFGIDRYFKSLVILAFLYVVAVLMLVVAASFLPFLVLTVCVELIYGLGPLACAVISTWRIAKLNLGNWDHKIDSVADMMAALNIFYSLILFQGAMFGILACALFVGDLLVARHLLALEQLSEKWAKLVIRRYIFDISAKCRKDFASVKGMDLIKYAAELLDSESQEDYLYGARLLSSFIKKGEDVSWLLLPSTHRIQRLIESLAINNSSQRPDGFLPARRLAVIEMDNLDHKKEIRELASTIVAHVAAHIDDLSKYSGAMRCISSLLQHQEEITHRNSKQVPDDPLPHQSLYQEHRRIMEDFHYRQEVRIRVLIRHEERRRLELMADQERMVIREHRHRHKREQGGTSTSNQLIQQGLTILERLASNNDDNRRIICSSPGLLPEITAPVFSATLIQDVKTKAWADIVTRSLRLLYQLIRPPGRPSRRLRRQIFSKHQALSNLKSILELGNEADHQELQLVSMNILTELALDRSINLTEEIKKVLVTKQLQLFLLANGDDEEESAAIAGRAMVSLSTNSKTNSLLIMTTQDDIISRLTGILDDVLITRRTIAAEIMANLCAHCDVDNNMKEILLPNVLREIMSIKIKSEQRNVSAGQNASGDEENQGNYMSINNEERHNTSRVLRLFRRCLGVPQQSPTGIEEISDQEREEQEAFLSLAQVICDKLDCADLDGAIQKAIDQNNAGSEEQRREAFVDKLKTIIDDNCHPAADSLRDPAADSLRIVKLCGRIAKSVLGCEQYKEIFRNRGFKSSLSIALETMSELESCMLFVGTDFGLRKTVRPLFSEIEKSFSQI